MTPAPWRRAGDDPGAAADVEHPLVGRDSDELDQPPGDPGEQRRHEGRLVGLGDLEGDLEGFRLLGVRCARSCGRWWASSPGRTSVDRPISGRIIAGCPRRCWTPGRPPWPTAGQARSAFEAVLVSADLPRAHDGLAEALWWLGEPQAALAHRERAFVGFRRAGRTPRRPPRRSSVRRPSDQLGNGAAAAGWLARAESRRRGSGGVALADARVHGARRRRGVRADAPLHQNRTGDR